MKVKTHNDAFKGMDNWNNIVMSQDLNKEKLPIIGKSGSTMRFTMPSGGSLYLATNQYDVIDT